MFQKVTSSATMINLFAYLLTNEKKTFKNHVRKRIKIEQIEEAPIAGLGDDEDAEFIGGPIIKKSKEKKKG